ncbi:MAG TPA: YihY/virulence factor BrkB family protein [Actinomycetota bacterium]|nr:YihY/virulence factor BrkB family protein [Actinomycetota bacterium]
MSLMRRLMILRLLLRWRKQRRERPSASTPHRGAVRDPARAGRAPQSPLDLEPRDWKRTLRGTLRQMKEDRISFAAAAVTYYLFLAIFPALIAVVGILGLAAVDPSGLEEGVRAALPGGAGDVLADAVANANRPSQQTSLVAAVVGVAVALWSGSSGMVALQTGLNVAYDIPEERRFVKKRAVALALLLATLLLGGVPSPFFVLGEGALAATLGWVATALAVMLLFSIFYSLGPNRDAPRWRWVTPGGIVGGGLWIVLSLLFGLYISNFGDYGRTYGALAGVIVLLLWLYLSSLVVLVGAELNAELEDEADPAT